MAKTNLEEIVRFPALVKLGIGNDEKVVALLLNDPNVEIGSDEANEVYEKYLFDYDYVDGITEEAKAYVCIETEVLNAPSVELKEMSLFITILIHKDYMTLPADKFPGVLGNRRDNLAMAINNVVDGSDAFGIGKLQFEGIRTIGSPADFTARELRYTVPAFK